MAIERCGDCRYFVPEMKTVKGALVESTEGLCTNPALTENGDIRTSALAEPKDTLEITLDIDLILQYQDGSCFSSKAIRSRR